MALALVSPAEVSAWRAVADSSVSKDELFVASVETALSTLSHGVGQGTELRSELVSINGGLLDSDMPWEGAGTFSVASGSAAAQDPDRRVITVLVRTEDGIPVDPGAFAEQVMGILNDPRGWGDVDRVSFARTDVDAEADVVITLASPATTELLCGELPTGGYTSCGRGRPVNINGARWSEGAPPFLQGGGTLEEYRAYVVNHELGHSLGHPHEQCPASGELAPVMLQQTLTVGSCVPNAWPNP